MKLLIATQNFAPAIGGIEQYASALSRALSDAGAAVSVLAPEHPAAREHDAELPFEVVRYTRGPAQELGLMRALAASAAGRYDAVLCMQWTSALWPAATQMLQAQPPLAIVCHGKEVMPLAGHNSLRAHAESRLRRRVLQSAAHVIAVSRFTSEHAVLAGAHQERVQVIAPGVDATRFANARPTPNDLTLLTVARLVERKGIDTVLRALPDIARAHPGVRYRIAGEGPDRARLAQLAEQLGVSQRLQWLGRVAHADLPALYASAELFLLPSRSLPEQADVEGFGLVLLEAQAAGVPVIAARSGGMPDAMRDGQTGLLIAPSDAPALSAAVIELLADRPRLQRMAHAARAHAATMTWSASGQRVLEVLAGTR